MRNRIAESNKTFGYLKGCGKDMVCANPRRPDLPKLIVHADKQP